MAHGTGPSARPGLGAYSVEPNVLVLLGAQTQSGKTKGTGIQKTNKYPRGPLFRARLQSQTATEIATVNFFESSCIVMLHNV